MEKTKFQKRFIFFFVFVKLALLCLTGFLTWGKAYSPVQMADIRAILFPIFSASLIIMLKFLYKVKPKEEGAKRETLSSLIPLIIFTCLFIYTIAITMQLFQLNVKPEAFQSMKTSIAWIEGLFSAVFGWVIADVLQLPKEKKTN